MPESSRPPLDIEALLGSIDRSGAAEIDNNVRKETPQDSGSLDSKAFDPAEFLDTVLAHIESVDEHTYEPEPVETLVNEEHISVGGLTSSTQARTGRAQQPTQRTKPPRGRGSIRRERNDSSEPEEDLVRMYLKEIGQYPLLTKDDEVELAQKMEAGKAASIQLENCDETVTTAERRELKRRVREGSQAERTFVNSNLRLVVSIAKRYKASGLPLLDLIQEGNIGLMHAVEMFDWRKGFKFSTYGTWWIRQAVTRGIANTGRTIRLPVHAGDTLKRVLKARAKLKKDDVEPSIEQLAAYLEMDPERVVESLLWASDPLSLSQPLNDDPRADTLGDLIPDRSSTDGYDDVDKSDLPSIVSHAFKCLDEREREILTLRFALSGGDQKTLEEVGGHFNLTRERIRQIEARAMTKLRHPSNGRALEAFIEFSKN